MNFLDRFSKNTQISDLIKVRPVEAELFHADGQANGETDRREDITKLIDVFRNFANAPKNVYKFSLHISFQVSTAVILQIFGLLGFVTM